MATFRERIKLAVMNTHNNAHLAKTVLHGHPVGELSDDDIQRRAEEIAVTKGRDASAVQSDDLAEARAELRGDNVPDSTAQDEQSIGTLSRDPSDPPAISGRATPNLSEATEQDELEHLVLDGVEEAQHDQMVEANKRRQT